MGNIMVDGKVVYPWVNETISTGSLEASGVNIKVSPEAGVEDDLTTITGGAEGYKDGQIIFLTPVFSIPAITINIYPAGNIEMLPTYHHITLTGEASSAVFIYRAATSKWLLLGITGSVTYV